MNERYDFRAIEEKWQARWAEWRQFEVQEQSDRPKYYVLEMLPYPSGALHMGHVRNYSLGDSVARYKRMRGYNVLHPIGWDAFGLPAENAAIRYKVPPQEWTDRNIARMQEQCRRMGWSYDWTREIATCRPDYYRWNQWFFIQMFKRGLAYRRRGIVNWCEQCQTVLANEQAKNGRCWRDESPVVERELEQWYLRTADYAEELLKDLERLETWPEKVLTMQRNWIGKSLGAQVCFEVAGSGDFIEIFTTRLDTIFGATFLVLAPEHDLVRKWQDDADHGASLRRFVTEIRSQTKEDRIAEEGEKKGVFTGRFAVNPYNQERVPIWVANFVLMEYGTGAIMAVPAHDQRDFEFAQRYELPIRTVVVAEGCDAEAELTEATTGYGSLVHSGEFNGLSSEEAQQKMADRAVSQGFGKPSVTFRIKDWGISRQRYWGTPIPILYCDNCGTVPVPEEELPVELPRVEGIRLGGSPLAAVADFVEAKCPQCEGKARRETDTMDTFVDSSWYFFRYTDPCNDAAPYDSEIVKYWFPVDIYIGGIEHAVLHLIYMRFFSKVMRDLGLVSFDEPVRTLYTQGMVIKDGAKMSKSKGNVVSPDEVVRDFGADAVRLFIQFCAPPDGELDWSEQGLEGCSRFLRRLWRLLARCRSEFLKDAPAGAIPEGDLSDDEKSVLRKLHQTIRKVGSEIERLHQNTAISAIMELLNSLSAYVERERVEPWLIGHSLENMALLMAPFAPHFAEEMWEMLGHRESIVDVPWPSFDPELAREEEIWVVVQCNGKVRSRFSAPAGVSREEMQRLALADEKVQRFIAGRTVRRVIVVPGKLVNIVIG